MGGSKRMSPTAARFSCPRGLLSWDAQGAGSGGHSGEQRKACLADCSDDRPAAEPPNPATLRDLVQFCGAPALIQLVMVAIFAALIIMPPLGIRGTSQVCAASEPAMFTGPWRTFGSRLFAGVLLSANT